MNYKYSLPVNLVLDIAHGDEGSHDACPLGCLKLGSYSAVMHVARRRDACATVGLCEE